MEKTVSIFLLLLIAGSHALAENNFSAGLRSAQQALAAGDYPKAYAHYSRLAAKNPLAQFTLGLFHLKGWGRPADEVTACRWFEKSASHNIPAAQHYLGDCLVRGTHRSPDSKTALTWYRKAAAGGHLISLCSAADLYIRGDGVNRDAKKGLDLCHQAAQAGSPPAMLKLANYYREGLDIARDLTAARNWYQQAAERGSSEAQYRLGVMLSEGQGGKPDVNSALFWLESSAAEGYAPAYLPTAILYANAEVDPETSSLKPEHLAKIYLWINAAKACTTDSAQLDGIARIDAMVQEVMPIAWRASLNRQVTEHLAKFNPEAPK